MIVLAALLIAQAAPPPVQPPMPAPVAPAAPADWSALPPIPWRVPPVLAPDVLAFVDAEVQAGRCRPPSATIAIAVALYVRADGAVRSVVPEAIDCPTVEQFAAGLVTSFARSNLRLPAAGWYRTTLTFAPPR